MTAHRQYLCGAKFPANVVPCDKRLRINELPKALPWMAPTLTSEKSRTVSLADAHPLQAYFGMPRRIRLAFSSEPGICSMTDEEGPLVTGFIQKPYGTNYGMWQHPLTPYRRQKEAGEPYSAQAEIRTLRLSRLGCYHGREQGWKAG